MLVSMTAGHNNKWRPPRSGDLQDDWPYISKSDQSCRVSRSQLKKVGFDTGNRLPMYLTRKITFEIAWKAALSSTVNDPVAAVVSDATLRCAIKSNIRKSQ